MNVFQYQNNKEDTITKQEEISLKKYISFLANSSNHPYLTYDDIIFTGLEGLVKAKKTYNANSTANFKTYARRVIFNEIASVYSKSKYRDLETSNEEVFMSNELSYDPTNDYDAKFLLKNLIYELSDLEIEVVKLLLKGYKISEIAKKLHISYKKVDNCMQSIKRKIKKI